MTLLWSPAHSRIDGNEKADALAKRGTLSKMYGPEPFLPLCEKKCRFICNTWLQESIKRRWNGTIQCSNTRSFMASPSAKTASQLLSLDKLRFSYTVGILTGHIRLNAYLKRIQVRDDPDCDFCGRGEETSIHFLCNCPSLSHIRRTIFGLDMLTPNEVFNFHISKIYDFVYKSGRFASLRSGHTADQPFYTRRPRRLNALNALQPPGTVTQ